MNKQVIQVLEKEVNVKERSVTHYISKKTLDRGKDIVLPDSIDDKNYAKNPIVLFNHNGNVPVGRSMWRKPDDDGVLAKTQFGTTPMADDIYQLNKEGILNAWSIGFMPKKWDFDEETHITTYTDIELLEYSSVSVPMNQDAVTEGLKMVKSFEVKELFEKQIEENEVKDRLNSFDKELKELRDLYNKLSEMTNSNYIEDLEEAEKQILELKQAINLIKNNLSVETLGSRKVFDEILENLPEKLAGSQK